jgi:hypothetical protein
LIRKWLAALLFIRSYSSKSGYNIPEWVLMEEMVKWEWLVMTLIILNSILGVWQVWDGVHAHINIESGDPSQHLERKLDHHRNQTWSPIWSYISFLCRACIGRTELVWWFKGCSGIDIQSAPIILPYVPLPIGVAQHNTVIRFSRFDYHMCYLSSLGSCPHS